MRNALVFALVLAPLASGCDGGDSSSGPKRLKIAVIPKGTSHEFWKSVHAGAKRAAAELGVDVIWKGPVQENDRTGQITEVENFISRGVDGICLAPLDDIALRKPVETAVEQGIPVVIFDSGIQTQKHVSFVATDNYKGGQLAGAHMGKLLEGKGKVILLRYMEGSASTMNREQGFLEALAKHPGIEVVSSNRYAGATADTALSASENLLNAYKTGDGGLSVDGIFCPNESSAVGMLKALSNGGHAGKVKFIGFDISEKLLGGLEAGGLQATVLQDPVGMGYEAVKTMVAHLRGDPVDRRIDTGATLVTPDNMERPEVQKLLHPEQAE